MRLLLDTHALLWWLADSPSLSARARKLIGSRSNTIAVSAASAWEIATKTRLGKLSGAESLLPDFEAVLARESFEALPIVIRHATVAGSLTGPHKDPFDRMLIAQCQLESLPVLSLDPVFDHYQVRRLWD